MSMATEIAYPHFVRSASKLQDAVKLAMTDVWAQLREPEQTHRASSLAPHFILPLMIFAPREVMMQYMKRKDYAAELIADARQRHFRLELHPQSIQKKTLEDEGTTPPHSFQSLPHFSRLMVSLYTLRPI